MEPGELEEPMQELLLLKKDEEEEAGSVSVFWYKLLLFQCPRDLPGAGELVSNL